MFRGGRFLGDSVALPVDTTTRAFRRACSEPRFPFARLERDAVTLRDAPIEFRWAFGFGKGETPPPELQRVGTSPARSSPEIPHTNPHHHGYGPLPIEVARKAPPKSTNPLGILGSHPATRDKDPEVRDDEHLPAADMGTPMNHFPPLSRPGPDNIISPSPSPSPPPPESKPRFPNLANFLGYFHKNPNSNPTPTRSYSQVVRAALAPVTMVPPVQNRGGGRDGFGAGRQGRGAGNVWQRTGGGRYGDGHRGGRSGSGGTNDYNSHEHQVSAEPAPEKQDELGSNKQDLAEQEEGEIGDSRPNI